VQIMRLLFRKWDNFLEIWYLLFRIWGFAKIDENALNAKKWTTIAYLIKNYIW